MNRKLNPYIFAVIIIALAGALRIWPLHGLESTLAWLTFYPAVMAAALYGGFFVGLLATAITCLIVVFGWRLMVAHPYIDTSGDWVGFVVFILTGMMISWMAEAMRRANKRAVRAQMQAEAANRAKSTFLASMSHELRTPLNAILGFSAIMRNDAALTAKQRDTMDIINRSGEHLLNLINDVLDMAKIEAGSASVRNAPFDLDYAVRDIAALLHGRAEEKNLRLYLDPSSKFPRIVLADAGRLRQILMNLIGNAIKFTEQGEVCLRLSESHVDDRNCFLKIEVEDTGVGIAPDDLSRIFDSFVQVGSMATQKGTGLGLSIARTNAGLMGGTIEVKSTPGKGSCFTVRIPVTRVDSSAELPARINAGQVTKLAPGQPEYRILIIEDQMENWLLLRHLLEETGFLVSVAENGALGVEAFNSWHPHFIFMDIRMPVMDGIEATRHIRQILGNMEVKIVALTASVFEEQLSDVIAAGMDDLIRKPYKRDEIFVSLEKHLGAQFLRDTTSDPASHMLADELSKESMAALPPDLLAEFVAALLVIDVEMIAAVIKRIAKLDAKLGEELAQKSESLAFSEILQVATAANTLLTTEIR